MAMNSGVLSHGERGEPRQIGLFGLGTHTPSRSGCPIEVEQIGQIDSVPSERAHESEQPSEAVRPAMKECLETQQHVEQQSGPDLPAHGVGTVADEVAQLQGLLDLFEEHLDLPAAAVKVGDGGWGPLEVVGQKRHHHLFAVEFDPGGDPAHPLGIRAAGVGLDQDDFVVAQDATARSTQALFNHAKFEVFLTTGDPTDRAHPQLKEVREVDIGTVEDNDLPGADACADFAGPGVIIVASGIDDGEARQQAV